MCVCAQVSMYMCVFERVCLRVDLYVCVPEDKRQLKYRGRLLDHQSGANSSSLQSRTYIVHRW